MASLLCKGITTKPQIENIVATDNLENEVNLEMLAVALGLEKTECEPEQFPSLIYRGEDFTMLVFSNGKFVFTGLTDLEKVNSVATQFKDRIQRIST